MKNEQAKYYIVDITQNNNHFTPQMFSWEFVHEIWVDAIGFIVLFTSF